MKSDTSKFHDAVAKMYSWNDIARRTENVYNSLDLDKLNESLLHRLQRYYCCGIIAGKLYALCVIVDIFIFVILEWLYPADHIDKATKWPLAIKEEDELEEETFIFPNKVN